MNKELPKAFEAKKYEDDIYARWEASGFFNPDVCVEKGIVQENAASFSIVLPPPNVTGTLHMGHAAMLAIEDLMVRYHRMKGDRTVWVPGTDHAAIATESKVEALLIKGGMQHPKEELGREEFLKRVDQFAKESHDTIVNQSKKMGSSLDWSREAFTLDAPRNTAVRTVFKKMYDDGLIYRGARLVNWDPKMQCNVADDEIEWKEEKALFYYLQYGPFVIGTARPETKFGDKYVVVHPDDERYAAYTHGQKITLEWINGPITTTVIKDNAVDMTFGSGVMTITPWHDAVDFDLAERQALDKEQIIDLQGKLLPIAGEFTGLPILEARQQVVEKLRAKGLVVKIDDTYVHRIAVSYRGGGVIEPQIREQWFIDVNKKVKNKKAGPISPKEEIQNIFGDRELSLKERMQTVVRDKHMEIIPDRFNKTYFHWIDNLRDWCISRQIWYGHRIPVYYCMKTRKQENKKTPCDQCVVSVLEITQCQHCGGPVEQDPDTLDTWFSSGLWTFSTLGWPSETLDLKNFHPTSVLETGYDILFFWVARMILMTTYVLGVVPFKTVYLHGLVRDEQGRKMSKSLGNIINPLDMIEKYGTDATRLSLLLGNSPGNDMRLSEEKIAGFRNFTNKLWNIARFMLLQIEMPNRDVAIDRRTDVQTVADAWILDRLERTKQAVTKLIEDQQFSYAGEVLRDFTWTELADWYLEIAKVEGKKAKILNYILNTVLNLWHPFMPFVTEALWQEMYGNETFLLVERWPGDPHIQSIDNKTDAEKDFFLLQDLITAIRTARAENKIEPAKKLDVIIAAPLHTKLVQENIVMIKTLARLEDCIVKESAIKPAGAIGVVVQNMEVFIQLAGVIDVVKEKERLQKEIDTVAPYVAALEKKLTNEQFVQNAPPAVIEAEKKKLAEAKEKLLKITAQYQTL